MSQTEKVVAIIQARLGSSRLPGKVLLPIGSSTMLERVVQRVRRARQVDEVVVATTTASKDDQLASFCRAHGIAVFRGSEDDVLDRYHRAALAAEAQVIVRVTSDCPLIDPEVIDRVITLYGQGGVDYVANNFRYTYPQGLDTEVFSLAVLTRAWREAQQPAEREHVTPYLRSRTRFRLGEVVNDEDLSQRNLRWTVDEPADLAFMQAVYARLDGEGGRFGMADVLALLQREPGLASLNAGIIRHEGYYLSLIKEKPIAPIHGDGDNDGEGNDERPPVIERGQGCRVWDAAGNAFADLHMDGGNVILGHHHASVSAAVTAALRHGAVAFGAHPLAAAVAEILRALIPGAEDAILVESGVAAERLATHLAQRQTGRRRVLRCRPANSDALGRLFSEAGADVAALIVEPTGVPAPNEPAPASGFFAAARAICRSRGALLIVDERRTAFRYALGGAQVDLGINGDLTVLGPSLANGYPAGAVVGAASLLRRPVGDNDDQDLFRSPSPLALAAALATLQELRTQPVVGHLWEQGGRLRDGFNVLATHYGLQNQARSHGPGPLSRIVWRDDSGEAPALAARFSRACRQRGLLLSDVQAVSFSHGQDDTDQILRVYRSVLEIAASGWGAR
ncbi:MAG TPA: aminotransferase class III-fold pyridoxal phosphate-dependent enzyme [Polyangia bacterium]